MPKLINATSAKNRFGEILRMAEKDPVYILKHGKANTVVVSASQYEVLTRSRRTKEDETLDELRTEFNEMYAQMQEARWQKGVDRLIDASADELNRVAARRLRTRAKKSR